MKFSAIALLPFLVVAAVAEPFPKKEPVPKKAALNEGVEVREESAAAAYTNVRVNTAALLCRKCPRVESACVVERQYSKGTIVKVSCDTADKTTSVNGYPWWGKTDAGCWISEYYVDYYQGAPPSCSK